MISLRASCGGRPRSAAVHERAGVAFVGVADEIFWSLFRSRASCHFIPVGKPPPPRPRRPDFITLSMTSFCVMSPARARAPRSPEPPDIRPGSPDRSLRSCARSAAAVGRRTDVAEERQKPVGETLAEPYRVPAIGVPPFRWFSTIFPRARG